MRIVHLSDIHFWHLGLRLRDLPSKRTWGLISLFLGRARRFRLERVGAVVERVLSLQPDHILISGDLTTTSSEEEFRLARKGLAPLLEDPARVSVIPGNHDRYTHEAEEDQLFEAHFGEFMPEPGFPWLRKLDSSVAILGLDPCRAGVSAQGMLPTEQIEAARGILRRESPRSLIVACHYPLSAPPLYQAELAAKRMSNSREVARWLREVGPHLYCCGHVHAAWAYEPPEVPAQLCLNAGAPLFRDPHGYRPPGFLEIELEGDGVAVRHHAWYGSTWGVKTIYQEDRFFARPAAPAPRPADEQGTGEPLLQ